MEEEENEEGEGEERRGEETNGKEKEVVEEEKEEKENISKLYPPSSHSFVFWVGLPLYRTLRSPLQSPNPQLLGTPFPSRVLGSLKPFIAFSMAQKLCFRLNNVSIVSITMYFQPRGFIYCQKQNPMK